MGLTDNLAASRYASISENAAAEAKSYADRAALSEDFADQSQESAEASAQAAIQAETAKQDAIISSEASAASADSSLASANEAAISAAYASTSSNVYLTVAAAQAAITAGTIPLNALFNVNGSTSNNYVDQYQNISGTAQPTGKSSPSSVYVSALATHVNGIDTRLSGGYYQQFLSSPALTGTPESISRTRINGTNFTTSGTLSTVTVFAETAGAGKVKIVTPGTAGTYSLVSEFNVTFSVGSNVFVSGVHFSNITVTTSQTIAVYGSVGRMSVTATGSAPDGSSFIANSDLTGSNVAVTSTTNIMEIQAVVLNGAGRSFEQLSTDVYGISSQLSSTDELNGIATPGVTGTVESIARTRIIGSPFAHSGTIKSIKLYIHTAGAGKIKIVRSASSFATCSLVNEFSVTVVAGLNTFVAGVDFTGFSVAAGDNLAFYGSTARLEVSANFGGASGVSYTYNGDLTVAGTAVVAATNIMQMNGVVSISPDYPTVVVNSSTALQLANQNQTSISNISLSVSDQLRKSIITESQRFSGTTLPSTWVTSGAVWSVNNSLIASGTGSATTIAYLNSPSAMARKVTRARIKMVTATSRAGIAFFPPENSRGTAVLINGSTGQLEINLYTGLALTSSKTVSLPSAIVANREYMLEVKKIGISTIATLRDTVTGVSITLSQSQGDGYPDAGAQMGSPGILFVSGSITVLKFDAVSCVRQDPAWIILGDSIVEGSNNAADWPKMWGYLLENARGKGDTLVAARGGDETTNLLLRLGADLNQFSPKYVIYETGTNDTSQTTWRTNTQTIINAIVARGAIPILCTQVPRPSKQSQITAQNADIRAKYFGNYDYIDLALAVSVSNAGLVYDPTYYQSDQTHLTVDGEAKLFAQVLSDAPYLLD